MRVPSPSDRRFPLGKPTFEIIFDKNSSAGKRSIPANSFYYVESQFNCFTLIYRDTFIHSIIPFTFNFLLNNNR